MTDVRGFLFLFLSLLPWLVEAADDNDPLRLTTHLALPPAVTTTGACVAYKEGGLGWLARDPVFWLSGTVETAKFRPRSELVECVGARPEQPVLSTREQLIQAVRAADCGAQEDAVLPRVMVRVTEWETPWGKEFALKGRLYRGYYLNQQLIEGAEVELPPTLLVPCD
jgi:hypothetical protein